MRLKNFNLVIVLIAEILVAVYGYVYRYSLNRLTITMAIVFFLFFIIGTLLQSMSNRLFAEVEAQEAERLAAEQSMEEAGSIATESGSEQ